MATYSRAAYDAARYAAARPTYPRVLTDLVSAYHARGPAAVDPLTQPARPQPLTSFEELGAAVDEHVHAVINTNEGRWDSAVDLGCGTGTVTRFRFLPSGVWGS